MAGLRRLHATGAARRGALRDHDPAAQRDGCAAHGARAQRHAAGRGHPLPAHARPGRAVAAGHGPRRHRHPGRGREEALRRGEEDAPRARARGLRAAHLGVEGGARQQDPRAVPAPRSLLRLDAHALHARAAHVARRARSLRAPVREGPRLSRRQAGELGLRARDGRVRRRGRDDHSQGHALPPALPAGGRRRALDRGHHAPGNDGRGHRRGRAPGRRTLPRADREELHAALRRARDPDRGRRDGRSEVRHGRGQDHARARSGGLRARRALQAADRQRADAERAHERERGALPGAFSRGGAQARRGRARSARIAREERELHAQRAHQRPLEESGRAAGQRAVVREDASAGGARDRGREERRAHLQARALDQGLSRLARERARLVHQPPAVVGASHPGLLRRGRRARGRARGPAHRLEAPTHRQAHRAPGRGRARYLGLVVAVALRDPRLAGQDGRPRALLSDAVSVDRARHPLPVGGAHGHGRLRAARSPADGAALSLLDLLRARDRAG